MRFKELSKLVNTLKCWDAALLRPTPASPVLDTDSDRAFSLDACSALSYHMSSPSLCNLCVTLLAYWEISPNEPGIVEKQTFVNDSFWGFSLAHDRYSFFNVHNFIYFCVYSFCFSSSSSSFLSSFELPE